MIERACEMSALTSALTTDDAVRTKTELYEIYTRV